LFTGWEGFDLSETNSPRLTFQLAPAMTNLVAHFRPSPFPHRAGNYSGLFINTNAETAPIEAAGEFDLTVTGSGKFTGKLRMNGFSYPFHAAFDISGNVLLPVVRPGHSPVVLAMHLEIAAPSNYISGFATNLVGITRLVSPLSAVFTPSTSNQLAVGGHRFNLVDANENNAVIAQAQAGVTHSSSVTLFGVTQGSKFTVSSRASAEGLVPFYLSTSHGGQAFAGWLHLTEFGGADGKIFWMRSDTNSVSDLDVSPPAQ